MKTSLKCCLSVCSQYFSWFIYPFTSICSLTSVNILTGGYHQDSVVKLISLCWCAGYVRCRVPLLDMYNCCLYARGLMGKWRNQTHIICILQLQRPSKFYSYSWKHLGLSISGHQQACFKIWFGQLHNCHRNKM